MNSNQTHNMSNAKYIGPNAKYKCQMDKLNRSVILWMKERTHEEKSLMKKIQMIFVDM